MAEEPDSINRSDSSDGFEEDHERLADMVDVILRKFGLTSMQTEFPLQLSDKEIARKFFDEIVNPLKNRTIGLLEARLRWQALFEGQPTVPNKYSESKHPERLPTPDATESEDPQADPFSELQPEPKTADSPTAPMTPIKPQWQNIDPPADDPDFVPNEREETRQVNGWQIVAASIRGKSHAHKGTFRDDSFGLGESGPWTFVAVSDGAGSSKLSRVSSQLACDEVIKSLKKTFTNYVLLAKPGDMNALSSDLTRVRAFLVDAARAAQDAVNRELEKRELTARDMYATLLVMAHCMWGDQEVVAALQVGDGSIGVFHEEDGKNQCTVLGDADHGDYSSETRFLITPGIEREFANRTKFTIKQKIRCIGVMSDGVSDDFFPEETNLIQLYDSNPIDIDGLTDAQGEPLQGVLPGILANNELPPPDRAQALVNWLQYEKRGSFDDRTLVLLYRRTM